MKKYHKFRTTRIIFNRKVFSFVSYPIKGTKAYRVRLYNWVIGASVVPSDGAKDIRRVGFYLD